MFLFTFSLNLPGFSLGSCLLFGCGFILHCNYVNCAISNRLYRKKKALRKAIVCTKLQIAYGLINILTLTSVQTSKMPKIS